MTALASSEESVERKLNTTKKKKMPKKASGETVVSSKLLKDPVSKIVSIEAFTPSVLNNQIVAMRKIVKVAHLHTIRKMNRQLKNMKGRLEKRANEKIKKQVDKLEADLVAIKTIKKDEVSKFALINKESLGKLLNKPNVSPSERVLFKLATSSTVESNVKAFRLSHPGCDVSCAFMLQRLGLQYQALRAEKVGDQLKKKLKSGETIDVNMNSDVVEYKKAQQDSSGQLEKKKEKSVIEKVLSKSIEKAKKEEKKTALNKKKKGEKIPEAPIEVKPIDIVKPLSKEAVVKKLNLQGEDSEEEEEDEDMEIESEDEVEEDSEGEESDQSDEEDGEEDSDKDKEEEDEEESDGEDAIDDGLSAFFLKSDGTSREVITSEMKDVEDEEIEMKTRGSIRGGMRGMRGGQNGRDRGNDGRMRGRMDRGVNRVGSGRGDRRGGRGERRGGIGERGGRGRGVGGKRDVSLPTPSSSSSTGGEQLHPSWIAKQKQKEIMKAGPSGKKITFD